MASLEEIYRKIQEQRLLERQQRLAEEQRILQESIRQLEEFQRRDFYVYPASAGGRVKRIISSEPDFYSIRIKLLSNDNSFSIDTSGGVTVYQSSTVRDIPSGDQTVTGLNSVDYIYITLKSTNNGDYFKFTSDTVDDIYLNDMGDINTMNSAFRGMTSLRSFNVSNEDVTSHVTDMEYTWYECENLTDVPYMNTSNVITLMASWYKCFAIESFPLIDTSKVTNMHYSWAGCTSLKSFPLIDTGQVTAMFMTWNSCKQLTSFPLIDTSNCGTIISTWAACESLTDFPSINTINATSLQYSWANCKSLVKFPEINMVNVQTISSTWSGCTSLECISGTIDFTSVTSGANTFAGCISLIAPPPSGTTVRDGDNALSGMWTNTNMCVT